MVYVADRGCECGCCTGQLNGQVMKIMEQCEKTGLRRFGAIPPELRALVDILNQDTCLSKHFLNHALGYTLMQNS